MLKKTLWAAFALLTLASPGWAQEAGKQTPLTLAKTVNKDVKLSYLLSLPKDYGKDPNKRWPLLMFLHGAGESGSDLEKLKVHGPPKLIAAGQDLPFVVVSPQCPSVDVFWRNDDALLALLDEVAEKYKTDPDRVYLTGLSMGGYGTWRLATTYPGRFAAIAPICGGGMPRFASRLKGMGIWVFHGAKDNVVTLPESQEMVDALKAARIDAKFTVYPEAGHDSWTESYANPELWEWFLKHKRAAQ